MNPFHYTLEYNPKKLSSLKAYIFCQIYCNQSFKVETLANSSISEPILRSPNSSSLLSGSNSIGRLLTDGNFDHETLQWLEFSKHEVRPFVLKCILSYDKKSAKRLKTSIDLVEQRLKKCNYLSTNYTPRLCDVSLLIDLIPAMLDQKLCSSINLTKYEGIISWKQRLTEYMPNMKLNIIKDIMYKSVVRPKMLCLHGYMQNAKVFKGRLGKVKTQLKNVADLIFIDAPIVIDPETNGRGYWSVENGTTPPESESGLRKSVETLNQALETHNPEGILAFSQSGSLVSWMVMSGLLTEIKFVIFVSSRLSPSIKYPEITEAIPRNLKSLHVIGEADEIITPKMSHALYEIFKGNNAKILKHEGRHFVPALSEHISIYTKFINESCFLKKKK